MNVAINKRCLREGLEKARRLVGAFGADDLSSSDIKAITIEEYQSPTFRRAGYDTKPELYGTCDRQVLIVRMRDKQKVIFNIGKISSDNPCEVGSAVSEGLDLRSALVVKFQVAGRHIISTSPGLKSVCEEGTERQLMYYMRRDMGTKVAKSTYER